jgi:NADPH2:quinone reductase
MLASNQALTGFALLPRLAPGTVKADLLGLFHRAASGRLKVIPGGSFSLERAGDAHRAIESRKTVGKVILLPHGNDEPPPREDAAGRALTSSA